MNDVERILFQAVLLLHKEILTVLSAIVPKAQADAIFESYQKSMQELATEMDNVDKQSTSKEKK